MISMVEKVARALCSYAGEDPDEEVLAGALKRWGMYVDEADVAIRAMQKPTKAMLDAGDNYMPQFREWPEYEGLTGDEVAGDVYKAMMSAALKGGPR